MVSRNFRFKFKLINLKVSTFPIEVKISKDINEICVKIDVMLIHGGCVSVKRMILNWPYLSKGVKGVISSWDHLSKGVPKYKANKEG